MPNTEKEKTKKVWADESKAEQLLMKQINQGKKLENSYKWK